MKECPHATGRNFGVGVPLGSRLFRQLPDFSSVLTRAFKTYSGAFWTPLTWSSLEISPLPEGSQHPNGHSQWVKFDL